MTDKHLSPGKAAERLGVNRHTVWQWCNEGKLPYFKTLGGHRRIPAEAIDRLMEQMKGEA